VTTRQPQGRSTTQADCRWHGRGQGFESLSSTAKVLVKVYLILKDAWLSYATEGYLGLTDAVRPRSATL
jgi:hypothetical protein